MHGTGNDYIYINTMRYGIPDPEAASRKWSRPHTGIGSDGLVLIGNSDIADFSMRIFNADGSEARMCGNASRCIGKYLYEKGTFFSYENGTTGIKNLDFNGFIAVVFFKKEQIYAFEKRGLAVGLDGL